MGERKKGEKAYGGEHIRIADSLVDRLNKNGWDAVDGLRYTHPEKGDGEYDVLATRKVGGERYVLVGEVKTKNNPGTRSKAKDQLRKGVAMAHLLFEDVYKVIKVLAYNVDELKGREHGRHGYCLEVID
jgi:hypothetical protein